MKIAWIIPLLLLCSFGGCRPVAVIPDTDAGVIRTAAEFFQLKNDPASLRDQTIQIAGRIIRAKLRNGSVEMTAEWLPYPVNVFEGPEARSTGAFERRITVSFDAMIDEHGLLHGNEFIMLGKLASGRQLEQLQRLSQFATAFTADCLRIWETGGADLIEFIQMDPLDDSYPPPLEKTYCVSAK